MGDIIAGILTCSLITGQDVLFSSAASERLYPVGSNPRHSAIKATSVPALSVYVTYSVYHSIKLIHKYSKRLM